MSRSEHGRGGGRVPGRRAGNDRSSSGPAALGAGGRSRASWSTLAPLLVLLVGIAIRLEASSPTNQTPDETFYTYCGNGLYASGLAFMPAFIQDCWDHREGDRYPWPTRVGYFWLVAAAMRVLGDTTVNAGATLSSWASLAVLLLTVWLALRRLGPWVTAIALLFLATSPLDRAIGRRTWQDEIVGLLALIMVGAATRFIERPARVLWAAVFFGVAAAALTVKENAAFVYGFGTVAMTVAAWRSPGGARSGLTVLAGGIAAAVAAGALVLVTNGGIEPLRKCAELWKAARVPNDYMRHYQMGSPAYYAVGFMILNPVPFTLGTASAIATVLRAPFMRAPWPDRRGRALLLALAWFVLIFAVVAGAYPQKNLRFLSAIFVPVYVLASALVIAALEAVRARLPRPLFLGAVAAVVLGLCAAAGADLARFHHWFVVRAVPDLATPWFTR